ncbi:MAG: methylmalonate semialdehyde dehydrogenase [acylating] 1 [Planctomycetota bacterium]|nr:MAG: methylmalonate semialdehyde dehydrogenase [acylating] 1 [Planctomycetota bacterium]
MSDLRLANYIGGAWTASDAKQQHDVLNPATTELIAQVPMGGTAEVDAAVQAARAAYASWRRTPVVDRVQPLYRLKALLEQHAPELAATVTRENGKNLAEAMGSVRRGIQMVEVAIGAPSLMLGQSLEDVASGIDCTSVRQPMGVFAAIAPFNFPAMVPMWFFPFAVACGNTFIVKPSEQTPLSQQLMFELIHEAEFPAGVLNMVHGGKDAVTAIIEHPDIEGVSFVGSSPVAELVYRECGKQGKRVQALGGAKNFVVVMPDADREFTVKAIVDSAFGCCGERCLAAAVVLAVGDSHEWLRKGLLEEMPKVTVGDGSKPGIDMGPLITKTHMQKVLGYIDAGVNEGAELLLDGRGIDTGEKGWFVGPTLFDGVHPEMSIAREEIFGPVLCVSKVDTLDDAMQAIHKHPLANASSIFTTGGKHARQFGYEVDAAMAGVNIGVAAPMAFFGFGGSKGSFFGDLKAHGREAFDFYTDRKVIISRW